MVNSKLAAKYWSYQRRFIQNCHLNNNIGWSRALEAAVSEGYHGDVLQCESGMHRIHIIQYFPQPLEQVFGELTDHARFGQIIGADITRILDAKGDDPNGIGSVRRIRQAGVPAFEETVVAWQRNKLMHYRVSKGSPIKHHIGKLTFSEHDGRVRLDYSIEFVPRVALPGWGWLLKKLIQRPIEQGLARYAGQ